MVPGVLSCSIELGLDMDNQMSGQKIKKMMEKFEI